MAKKYLNLIHRYVNLISKFNTLQVQKDKARHKYKFGIQVPDNPRNAYLLDKVNGDNQWADAISKELDELDKFKVFRILPM